jgi:hypothetical protein
MKSTPVLLGIVLTAIALSASFTSPARANEDEYQYSDNSYSNVENYEEHCYFKRFYVPGSYDQYGNYHEGYWAVKKVCEVQH